MRKITASNLMTLDGVVEDPSGFSGTAVGGWASPYFDAEAVQRSIEKLSNPTLLRTLLDNGLVDQLDIALHPLVLGTGAKLFPDGAPRTELTLEAQSQLPSGVMLLTYTTA